MKALRILAPIAVLALTASASGQTVTTLYSFSGSDGQWPNALFVASDGSLYGTTTYGGTSNAGTVFRISPSGVFTSLYSFTGSDGFQPWAGVVQGNDGNFYGTTAHGGANTNCSSGCGTVFRIGPSGSFTSLYSFSRIDGYQPVAGLVQGSDGNFYGTTVAGGTNGSAGTVFRISPSGVETTFCSFLSPSYCVFPYGGLVQGSDGSFYGTTQYGGTNSSGNVFKISPSGSPTNLHSFIGSDGEWPEAVLVKGTDGNFYGTTYVNGGTVFRISPSGNFTSLYSLSNRADGFGPQGGLVQGSDGNFYGTTVVGGISNVGTIFQISPSGSYTNLHSFTGSDGKYLYAPLVQGGDGSFYGATATGGTNGGGTVFRISVPLNPPANQISAVQAVGNDAYLTIPSVAGETYQLQFATDLVAGNWSNVAGVCVSNSIGAALTVTNFGGMTGPQGFYRFAITP